MVNMDDNQDQMRHGTMSQSSSVRKENAIPLQPLVTSSLSNEEASTFRVHPSPTYSSHSRKMSPPNSLEALVVQVKPLMSKQLFPRNL